MSEPRKVKLFTGMIAGGQTALFEAVEPELEALFGQIDLVSPVWPWNHTTFYEKELGRGLLRKFVFFKSLIHPQELPAVKLKTTGLERKYLNCEHQRQINLDPGYLNAAKVVLASTKDYSHRLYLGHGIYGEVTLAYSKGAYRPFPYTYPDFRTEEYLTFFEKARGIYKRTTT
jgi:hypothetical protein